MMRVLSSSLTTALLYASTVEASDLLKQVINESFERLANTGFFEDAHSHVSVFNQPQKCINGHVILGDEIFDCDNVDFYSFLSLKDLEIAEPAHHDALGPSSADIWGWLSPSGREITLLSLDNGVVAIDGSDPSNPCMIAKMPTRRVVDKWADVKVYENTLYHVKDTSTRDANSPDAFYGIEVYDLLPLDQINCHVDGYVPLNLFPNFVTRDHGRSHNVVINPESGRLYSVGTEHCGPGGLMIYDIKTNPLEPVLIGCAGEDGYTHDAQCLTYDGPDQDYQGSEICFAYNEDTLTVWDVTDASAPVMVSRTFYPNQAYSHQGWVNDDLTLVLLDDELDEMCNFGIVHSICTNLANNLTGINTTTTDVFDISDLDNPIFKGAFDHEDLSIDHNLYVWGTIHRKGWGGNKAMTNYPDPNYAYMNNYLAGVKIVDIHSNEVADWKTVGSFDISPDKTTIEFAGAWSGYMHPSGVYAVSSIERGMFFLQPNMAYTEEFPKGSSSNDEESPSESEDDDEDEGVNLGLVAVILIVIAVALAVTYELQRRKNFEAQQRQETQPLKEKKMGEKPVATQNAMFDENSISPEKDDDLKQVL